MTDSRAEGIDSAVDGAIEGRLEAVWTMLPGRVTAYDAATQKATVQPLPAVKRDGETVLLPALSDVPVAFPQGGGFAMTWPIVAGDLVTLTFAARPLDAWKADQGEADPGALRMHGLSDAVAVPSGPRPIADPLAGVSASDVELTAPSGGKIKLAGGGKAAARQDDTTTTGQLSITAAGGGGGVIISLTHVPPSGAPNVQTVTVIGAGLSAASGGVAATLSGKINSGSAKVEIG